MGRRPDPPALQAAKGAPGKRMTKAERAQAEADHLALLLATAPAEPGEPLAPPTYLDKRFAPALAVWRDYAPKLAKVNLLEPLDRHSFALFCVYLGEWLSANEDILANGYSRLVKTVSGDKMPRESPSVARRDTALKVVLELSKRFGLTPLDRYGLFKDQAASPWQGTPLGGTGKPEQPPAEDPADDDPIGMLNSLDSPPPGRPN